MPAQRSVIFGQANSVDSEWNMNLSLKCPVYAELRANSQHQRIGLDPKVNELLSRGLSRFNEEERSIIAESLLIKEKILDKKGDLELYSEKEKLCASRENNVKNSINAKKRFNSIPPVIQTCLNRKFGKDVILKRISSCDSVINDVPSLVSSRPKKKKNFKKRQVHFADQVGRNLETVHEFRSQQNNFNDWFSAESLPNIGLYKSQRNFNKSVLERENYNNRNISKNVNKRTASGRKTDQVKASWKLAFAQPAADFSNFQIKLALNKVNLENVVLRHADETRHKTSSFFGTIKVGNIEFEKYVFLRITFDRWATFGDYMCEYDAKASVSGGEVYDTFKFDIPFPEAIENKLRSLSPSNWKAKCFEELPEIEFCVGYKSGPEHHWDNNGGANYRILPQLSAQNSPQTENRNFSDLTNNSRRNPSPEKATTFPDAYKYPDSFVMPFTQFAAWTHLNNDNPYW